jgi:flagellar hook-basal body complex protein FliE
MKVNVNTVEQAVRPQAIEPDAATGAADSFTEALKEAVGKVDAMQVSADTETQKLAQGEGNLHETMLALEKADLTMKVALKVRNKVLDAYNDVMRMQV